MKQLIKYLHFKENPDACYTASQIYDCGLEKQANLTKTMIKNEEQRDQKIVIQFNLIFF